MKVLGEFWHGNINLTERLFRSQKNFDKAFGRLTENEKGAASLFKIDFETELQRLL